MSSKYITTCFCYVDKKFKTKIDSIMLKVKKRYFEWYNKEKDMKGMIKITMRVNDLGNYNFENVKKLTASGNTTSMSTEEKVKKYFKQLKEDYSKINLRQNNSNVNLKDSITVNLSPELLKKAVKDPKVDKSLRKMLNDFNKEKGKLKLCNCSKSGHEVKSVSFLIDGMQNVSCSIRLKDKINPDVSNKNSQRIISSLILKQKKSFEKSKYKDTSLCYKYLDLLSTNKFKSLDFTV